MRRILFTLLLGLLALSPTACIGFRPSVEREPGVSQIEAADNTAVVAEATEVMSETPSDDVAVIETVTPEKAPALEDTVYAAKNGETLVLPGCFDFDEGVSLAPPDSDSACDFSVLPGPDGGTIEVYPQNEAQLAYGGVFPQAPALAQCAASDAYSHEKEIVAPMAAMYVCYQTSEGRTGYLHFTSAELDKGGTVSFDWLTFVQQPDGEN